MAARDLRPATRGSMHHRFIIDLIQLYLNSNNALLYCGNSLILSIFHKEYNTVRSLFGVLDPKVLLTQERAA